jgi:hypothetical protein
MLSNARPTLRLQVAAHVRARGDMNFTNVAWAGRVGPGLWIESFSVRPLERFAAQDIEYKGLTASGFETPWISDDRMCGTKGMSVPLVGFAVRLKPSTEAAFYDCEYSGYFQSGVTVGPLRNGVPCRSTVANDPLEGVQIRIVKRIAAVVPESTGKRPVEVANIGKVKSAASPRAVPVKASAAGKVFAINNKNKRPTGKSAAGKSTDGKTRAKAAPRTSARATTRQR